ncbi:GNAT family N-acetyltransferase [Halobacillus litoralis]|uniref:GNAT family N-acetyltransferase n=1 Tax=Halobacillus litoralis TaxID=45668 RepID=UPI001CD499F6|nr:GNAT family N-acetyltransferase [Halobacillus litoralis]MCA0970253.1 GNAT family N-acetyltransferase [Halobacillus litoralis]
MKIEKNETIDKERLTRFFSKHWGSNEMVISSGTFVCDELPGFTILIEDELVGCITFVEGKEFEVISLDSDQEGLGIGSLLLKETEAHAKARGYSDVQLITTNDNLSAVRFYQKREYRVVGVMLNAVQNARKKKPDIPFYSNEGIEIRDEWILRKEL